LFSNDISGYRRASKLPIVFGNVRPPFSRAGVAL